MFPALALPIVALTAILLAPGFLALRGLGLSRPLSASCAPVVSVGAIAILSEAYAVLGIPCGPLTLLGPALLLCAAPLALRLLLGRGLPPSGRSAHPAWVPAAFCAVGVVMGYNLFLSRLPSPDAVFQAYDVTQHLNVIQSFVDSGRYSSLGVGYYLSAADLAIDPVGYSSFYPAAWHATCALLVQLTGISVPEAINASMFVFSSVVFPLGEAAFLSRVLPSERRAVAMGAVVATAFVSFPWCLLVFGPLYPNLAGFAGVPAVAALFTLVIEEGAPVRRRVLAALATLVSLAGLCLMHPNTAFTIAVLLMPYLAQRIWDHARAHGAPRPRAAARVGAFALFCLAVWTACYLAPPFSDIVSHVWPPFALAWQEVINILSQTYTMYFFYEIAAQVPLAVLVVVGAIRSLYSREHRWAVCSYALACAICFVCATSDEGLAHFLGGFWYTDAMRLAVVAVMAAIPLAALGLDWVVDTALRVVRSYNDSRSRVTHERTVLAVALVGFFVLNLQPAFDWPGAHMEVDDERRAELVAQNADDQIRSVHTTFGDYRSIMKQTYLFQYPLDEAEQAFLDQVAEVVPEGELIVNNPMDGSFLAYGTHGLRVYYRDFTKFHEEGLDTEESKLIRKGLSDISESDEVLEAVRKVGARYVLVLSEEGSDGSFVNLRGDFMPDEFSGVTSITPDTPGFTLVLQSGQLCLYEIDLV